MGLPLPTQNFEAMFSFLGFQISAQNVATVALCRCWSGKRQNSCGSIKLSSGEQLKHSGIWPSCTVAVRHKALCAWEPIRDDYGRSLFLSDS